MHGSLTIELARTQNDGGEIGLVNRIGKMLCLQTNSCMAAIDHPALAGERAIKPIGGVKLDPRLGRMNL